MLFRGLVFVLAVLFGLGAPSLQAAAAGFLSGTFFPIAAGSNVNLSAKGPADWAHWGLYTENSYNHKANVTPQISNYAVEGNNWAAAWPYSDNFNGYSWSNGVPEPRVENTPTGVYVAGLGNGFRLTVPSGTNARTFEVFVGAWGARGRLEASLSDHSAPTFVATNIGNVENGPGGAYVLHYAAGVPGETLTVTYTVAAMYVTSYGNVTLQAAALDVEGANVVPDVWVATPSQGQTFYAPAAVFCKAVAGDADGTITNVEFFSGTNKIADAVPKPNTNTWSSMWTNVPAGSYDILARATDDRGAAAFSTPIRIYVINSGGSISGCLGSSPAKLDLSNEGEVDWAHWGHATSTSFNHKNGVTSQISNLRVLQNTAAERYANNFTAFSWSDGTPQSTALDSTTGVFVGGMNNGFELTVPAENVPRRLRVYVGVYGARGLLEAALSDDSAAPFVDRGLSSIYGNAYGMYEIDFGAAASNVSLRVTFKIAQLYDASFGNVTLQAATLADLSGTAIYNPRSSNNDFLFDVLTESNRAYTVQWSESAAFNTWNVLTNLIGDGSLISISDPAAHTGRRFYRIR